MIDFSVCIELAFAEAGPSVSDRVRAAADAGFPAVEIWDWRDKPLPDLARVLDETNTQLLTICAEHWRDKCQLADPASHAEFVRRVADTAKVASELGVPKIVVLAGDILPDRDIAAQRAMASEALLRASDAVAGEPVELLVEVVNRQFEGPNALLSDSMTALDLIRRLDRPNVRFLYDRYHAILNGEPLGWGIGTNLELVGHIQAADVPGRQEFGTGNQDWVRELRWLLDAGYAGHVGIEATPLSGGANLYRDARALLEATTS
ncbi:TIM barrel protein [Kaistia dalseonensis]|uniref:Hydroxypyruvate isomerase n=1 Tax=Kaistia dalseonensis TaxID=410840 RepID=A0ABU0H969_9HYPH|nr:TIM barrel protein [Kaistia dalseonensis]MCX5495454.1 TIM barrel protein [Kaistia dalseonensis]MDQ0438044.1 hydroxypyruvate isomerase [Kaistia dalseonensis]